MKQMTRHNNSWRIWAQDRKHYGVLIRYTTEETRLHVLVCPEATSTYPAGATDLTVCSSPSCQWDEIHIGATKGLRMLLASDAAKESAEAAA